MNDAHLIAMLAVLQYLFFGALVARARGQYQIQAPAVSGDERFERIYRVQMNTLELLVAFLPALYVASYYWSSSLIVILGVVYLFGRFLYWRSYVDNPRGRALGFGLSIVPVGALVVAGLLSALFGKG